MVTSMTSGPAGEVTAKHVRERAIGQRRGEIDEQIDRLYLAAPIDEADIALLYRLEASEREISAQRRRLHREIDELRARIGLQPWPAYHDRAA